MAAQTPRIPLFLPSGSPLLSPRFYSTLSLPSGSPLLSPRFSQWFFLQAVPQGLIQQGNPVTGVAALDPGSAHTDGAGTVGQWDCGTVGQWDSGAVGGVPAMVGLALDGL